MVEGLCKAAIAIGADGIMVEVHNDPLHAKCDGAQSIKPDRFGALMQSLRVIAQVGTKKL
jgi:3-deoxy-7-phosphoheptulonate synthase